MEEKIENIIKRHLNRDQVLVSVTENFDSGFLRVVIDSEFSITLNDTTSLSRDLIKAEEFNRRYPNGCRIEISTPGVDFPLKKAYQFRKNVNKNVQIRYRVNNKIESIKCQIIDAGEKSISVRYLKSDFSISYDQIEHAKVLLSFK